MLLPADVLLVTLPVVELLLLREMSEARREVFELELLPLEAVVLFSEDVLLETLWLRLDEVLLDASWLRLEEDELLLALELVLELLLEGLATTSLSPFILLTEELPVPVVVFIDLLS